MYGGSTMSIKNKKAFTLIELLVVVVIIGILAAVALPQYLNSVKRTRLTEGFVFFKSINDATKMYYLQHSEAPTSFDALDIQIPSYCDQAEKYSTHEVIWCRNRTFRYYITPPDTSYIQYMFSPWGLHITSRPPNYNMHCERKSGEADPKIMERNKMLCSFLGLTF
jgi:prepilin-type N-terminal cleavage/methylation domain-containing protein